MSKASLQSFIDYDKQHLWHPYASMTHAQTAFLVERAKGVLLTLADGREVIDGMSSWWAAIHGYNHPVLNDAIRTQTACMAHVMFGGLTHRPAIELAQTILAMTPQNLQHIFYTDSGSVAVEVAIKMALQYAQARGQHHKHRLLTLRHGYHGDTFGAMSVCDPVNGMHHLFSHMLAQQLFAAAPPNVSAESDLDPAISDFTRLLEQHHHDIAAVILEPIVQGAGGMRIYHADYLRFVRRITQEYDIPLIADEIATGFGRTGKLFACEHADITPDILCIGKALTGGYMTLGATLVSADIAAAISNATPGLLMHGPTFMANPLACAVALASTRLLLASPWQQRVQEIETQLRDELAPCKTLPQVADVRVIGAIGVVELTQPVNLAQLQSQFVDLGVWIRPFGKLVYIMPPYIIRADQLRQLTRAMYTVISNMAA